MKNFETVIGDITKEERMRRVFEAFHPQIVFHAAAYKHVPVMENNPAKQYSPMCMVPSTGRFSE
jgi:FlaA1/EpsC-like NDP-sugar epimerase